MCHYITAVLPSSADQALLSAIANRHGRKLEPLKNPSIEAQLKPGERYFLTTRGHCDCGTSLGALGRAEAKLTRRATAADVEEVKLRRKGWSEIKLARWREQKSQHLEQPLHIAETEDWLAVLHEMLEVGGTQFVGLLLHWYSGPIDGRIELQGRQTVGSTDISPEMLGRMKEDILYEFTA